MLEKNIYLIGLPYSGKSSIGESISKISGFDFFDTDILLEKEAQISINEIFKTRGEKYFRALETKILKDVCQKKHAVISTGGGVILSEENRNIIKNNGISIYIKRDIETLSKYVNYENRPLIKNINDLKNIFSQRETLYKDAANIEFYIDEWDNNLFEYTSKLLILINEYEHSDVKKLCVIGNPIEHSLSPYIHNSIYSILKINAVYIPIKVSSEESNSFLEYAKNNIYGFNATMPHKENIIKYMDKLIDAKSSINTVINKNKKLTGTSTDGLGFLYALKNIDIKNKNIVILGSGGAAFSIYNISLKHRANVCIISRDKNKAVKKYGSVYSYKEIDKALYNCDILVNATPLGMKGFDNFTDLSFLNKLPSKSIVFDSVYSPQKTSFLSYAKNISVQTIEGIDMLFGQAIYSHRFWFDKIPNIDIQNEIKTNIKKYLL